VGQLPALGKKTLLASCCKTFNKLCYLLTFNNQNWLFIDHFMPATVSKLSKTFLSTKKDLYPFGHSTSSKLLFLKAAISFSFVATRLLST